MRLLYETRLSSMFSTFHSSSFYILIVSNNSTSSQRRYDSKRVT